MMKTFKFVISTPDGNLFDDEIVKVSLRGAEGDLAILANHIPFVTSVQKGECHIELASGDVKYFTVDGGLLKVSQDDVALMSGSAKWREEQ